MKLIAALKATWHTYCTQFPQLLLTMLLQMILRVMALTPLLFLTLEETKMLALLCIPLYMLIVLPARQNVAACMQDALAGGSVFSLRLISMKDYGCKVGRGLIMTLLMMLWGSLFIGCTAAAVYIYFGDVDVFTLLKTLMSLGDGSSIKGATVVLEIYAATLLPLMLGVAFHSGTRHAAVLDGRKMLHSHRWGVVGAWMAGLVVLLPFAAVTAYIGMGYVSGLIAALASLGTGSVTLPPLRENLLALLAAAVFLLIPAIPFKQLLTAAYVRELKK